MANLAIQLLGFSLALLGFIGFITSTAMVQWKASSYSGDNIVTAQAVYEGLWMSCVSQSTGQVQCKVYDSLLQMPAQIQATRALMISGIMLSGLAVLVAMVGMKCTTCLAETPELKRKVVLTSGILFIIAGFCVLVGTSWFGNRIAVDFYNPFTPTNSRYEFGAALFVGWGAAALSMMGGGFLSCVCKSAGSGQATRYPQSRPAGKQGTDYV